MRGRGELLGSLKIEDDLAQVFTPEDLDGERKLLANIIDDFIRGEVEKRISELEVKKNGVMLELLEKASKIGLLGLDVPESFGGMGLDQISSLVITERIMRGGPFGLTQLVHTAFGSLPIILFGNEEQKQRWLPDLAVGRMIGAFALTEPDAGSDAVHLSTQATISDSAEMYVLNGQKQFTSNSSDADLVVVFGKVNGDQLTAFVVNGKSEGLTLGEEEVKMGNRGSSTRSIFLDNVRLHRGDLLLQPGEGHIVAFNTLNIGRHRLAGACVGMAKIAFEDSIRYAKNRRQFGKTIANFGLIKEKIAEMAVRIYESESLVYRTSQLLSETVDGFDRTRHIGYEVAGKIKEYAAECSMNKVHASEMLQYVTDESVQIHGGYGYVEDYPIERYYRDARLYRIFGGTNEINRLLIARLIVSKAVESHDDFQSADNRERQNAFELDQSNQKLEALEEQTHFLEGIKEIARMALRAVVNACSEGCEKREELMALLGNIATECFVMESSLLRSKKIRKKMGVGKSELPVALTSASVEHGIVKVERWARLIFAATQNDNISRQGLIAAKSIISRKPINIIELRRIIADFFLQANRYFIC